MSNRVFPQIVRYYNTPMRLERCSNARIVFHHIPKTAGSTFRKILESYYDDSEVCPAEIDSELYSLDESSLCQYRLYAGHFSTKCIFELFQDDIWLTFLRNPVTRIISNYFNLIDRKRVPHKWWKRLLSMQGGFVWREVTNASFEEYVKHGHTHIKNLLNNYQTWLLVSDGVEPFNMRRKSTDTIKYDSNVVSEAKRKLKNDYAFVGVQEEFDLSLLLFSYTFGERPLSCENEYARNINKYKDLGDIYLKHYPEIIERNQMDYELWEYSVGLLQERVAMMQHSLVSAVVNSDHLVIDTQEAVLEEAVFRMCDVDNIRGCYWLEETDGFQYRWTGYENPSIIEFYFSMVRGCSYRIEINISDYIDLDSLYETKVIFDDVELELVTVDSVLGKYMFTGELMAGYKNIHVNYHTIVVDGPAKIPNDIEFRKLGVAVDRIFIKCTSKSLYK